MKYWIFQNNQVLGPYEPDEMGKISVFSPESLVCPEGRRGTSMGDWQRAGMVPDLSVALVRASASLGSSKTSTLSIAGLPPEPTLKDLAQLGSIQEKVASLEDVVLQLQDGLRAKDAELYSVHQELAGKSREATEIRNEAVARQREADELKRQLAGMEERLASVRTMGETLDKAVEEEKRVEQDVEKQGQTLTDLAKDVEELRRQLAEAKARSLEASAASMPAAKPLPAAHDIAKPSPSAAPAPASAPVPVPVPLSVDARPKADPIPSFDSSMPPMPETAPSTSFDPMSYGGPSAGSLAPDATPPVPEPEAVGVVEPPPPPPAKGKKALLIGAVAGVAALGGLAVMGGFVPGMRKPKAPVEVVEPAPLPAPEPEVIAPPPDPRPLAVEFAKSWPLPGDRTLERALEDLAPSAGNLSPWMADPLAGSRMQVNYFARSSAPGAPTIAYEFEVDLEGRTLIGRNAAAKSVLTGKAAAPPAPPKPKPVRVKAKAPAVKAPETDSLDSLLGDGEGAPKKGRSSEPFGEGSTMTDAGDASPDEGISNTTEEEQPRKAKPGRRAAKAAKPAKAAPAADEALLDDLLQE